jgi:cell wall-associated NlpC family hydrolase
MKEKFDTTKYISIPFQNRGRSFDGCDCWGLVRLVYMNEYKTHLLSFVDAYQSSSDGEKVRDIVLAGKALVSNVQKAVPEYGDVVVFNIRGNPCHVGIYVGNNRVLHVMRNTDSVCERLNSPRLKGRIEGYYEIREERSGGSAL